MNILIMFNMFQHDPEQNNRFRMLRSIESNNEYYGRIVLFNPGILGKGIEKYTKQLNASKISRKQYQQ